MRKINSALLFFSFLWILSSFNKVPTDVPFTFPSSLKLAKGEIVLFMLGDKEKKNETLKEEINKTYLGEHEFVTQADLKLPKYENTQVYRYVFTANKESVVNNGIATECTKMDLEDRAKSITYTQLGSVIFKMAIKSYAESLEKHRLKS
jgi:hypothetical protein